MSKQNTENLTGPSDVLNNGWNPNMDEALPKSVAESTVTALGVALKVHVLDNGQRIIETDGMERLLAAMASGVMFAPGEQEALARAINGPPPERAG